MYKQRLVHPIYPLPRISSRLAAAVYNQAGNEYVNYADGDPERLFCFDGPHAYADRQLWSVIEKKLGRHGEDADGSGWRTAGQICVPTAARFRG